MKNLFNSTNPNALRNKLIAGGVIAFGLGGTLGATAQPEPERIVETVTVEKPVEKIVEKIVEKTPASCLLALDLAEQGFGLSAESMQIAGDAIQATARFDIAAVNAGSEDMTKINVKLDKLAPQLNLAKTECREAK